MCGTPLPQLCTAQLWRAAKLVLLFLVCFNFCSVPCGRSAVLAVVCVLKMDKKLSSSSSASEREQQESLFGLYNARKYILEDKKMEFSMKGKLEKQRLDTPYMKKLYILLLSQNFTKHILTYLSLSQSRVIQILCYTLLQTVHEILSLPLYYAMLCCNAHRRHI